MPTDPSLKKSSYVKELKQRIISNNSGQFPQSQPSPTASPSKKSNIRDFLRQEVVSQNNSSVAPSPSLKTATSSSPPIPQPSPTTSPPKKSNIIDFTQVQEAESSAFSLDQLNPKNAVIITAIANGLQKDNLLNLLNSSQKNKLLTVAKIQPYDTRAIDKFTQEIEQQYEQYYNQLASRYNPHLNDFQFKEQKAKATLSNTEIDQLGEEIFQTSRTLLDSNQPQTLIQSYFQKQAAVNLNSQLKTESSQETSSPQPLTPTQTSSPPPAPRSPDQEEAPQKEPSRTQTLRQNIAQSEQPSENVAPATTSGGTQQAQETSSPQPLAPTQTSSPPPAPSSPDQEEAPQKEPGRTQTLRQNIAQSEQPTENVAPATTATAAVAASAPLSQPSAPSSTTSSPIGETAPTPSSEPAALSSPDILSSSPPQLDQTAGSTSSPTQPRISSPRKSLRSRLPSTRQKSPNRLQKKIRDSAGKAARKLAQKVLQGLGKLLASALPYIWPILVALGIGIAGFALAAGGVATVAGGTAAVWTAVTAWVSSTFSPFDNATVQLANQAPAVDKSCAQCLTITKTSILEGGLDITGEAIDANNAKRARFTYTLTPNTDKCTDIKLNGDCSDLISIACRNTNSTNCPGVDPFAYQIPVPLADIIPNQAATNTIPNNYSLPANSTGGTAEDGNLDLLACNALMRALKTDNLHNYPMTEPITFNLDEFLPNGYSLPYGDDYRLDNTFILGYSGQPINQNAIIQPAACGVTIATDSSPIIPSSSENIIWSAESASLKGWVIQKSNYKLTRIWVSSPGQQINKFGSLGKQYALDMANSAINNQNLAGKNFVVTNASGFHGDTAFGKVIITNGQILRDDQSLTQGSEGNYYQYYTFNNNGTLGFYKSKTSSQILLNNYCTKNSFAFYPPLIENGKLAKDLYSTGENRMRQGFCQIDTNNYAIITGSMDLDDVAKIMINLSCQTGVNFDGGGSHCLYVKNAASAGEIISGCTSRTVPDILYFNEL